MNKSISVNFHCHSIFSDGDQTPETLASNLAAAGVRFAALTDHDSIEGLPRFQDALKKRGIAHLPGVEITTQFKGREAHLLAYGFDEKEPNLAATLLALRQHRDWEVHSIAGAMRKMGSNHHNQPTEISATSTGVTGKLNIDEAIACVHRAGGKTFLAHPLNFESDPQELEGCVIELKKMGLDGIEAFYASDSTDDRDALYQLALRHELLTSAGTDLHNAGYQDYSIEMPQDAWIQFRRAVFSSSAFSADAINRTNPRSNRQSGHSSSTRQPSIVRRRSFVLRIFLPTLIAILLFLTAFWGFMLPSFEQSLLERKRELIHELTNSAWSILASYERDVQHGLFTREQAQTLAIARIEALRYGPEGKDYFWIQNLEPRMIMHPYRSELNGKELHNFTDPRGIRIFVEFADRVRREKEGYVDYVWQWKDDPGRLEPKESFVKGFEPWGWIIGTGIYIDDVVDEIARIERGIVNASLIISGAVVLLLLFVLQQSLRIERERQEVVDDLRESTERYHSLIEATTEGTLLIIEGRCRYANPTFLNITGYTARQMEFLELADILPREADNQRIWQRIERLAEEQPYEEGLDGVIVHADGRTVECILALSPIIYAGQNGFILLAKDITRHSSLLTEAAISRAAQAAPVGIFRARPTRRATFIEMNPAAQAMLTHLNAAQPALADLFADPAEFESFFHTLQESGEIDNCILHLETSDATVRFISLSARLVRDDKAHASYIDGFLLDVTTQRRQETGREALIEKLQTSLLFLHEPIADLGREVVICDMHTTIEQLARRMTARHVTAALVSSESSIIIGIVTDHDLRARVLAEAIPLHAPIHTIMSSPLSKISENALVYEALMRMEEKGVRHLAVEEHNGRIVSIIDDKSLIQFQRYGPIVLTREIFRSINVDQVKRCAERTPALVKSLLDSSARPRHVTGMLASLCDAFTERLIQLAIEELGPPPAPFAFIAMGSQGRQEQTLTSDQDNGIIYASAENADLQKVGDYFLGLGSRVCDGLNRAGYPFCRGGVMANNPRWCRSLSDWISGFDEWIRKSEPQEIIDLSIFFDFRTVYGEADLTHQLRRAIHTALVDEPSFFHHFAQNALTFKPPFRPLGSLYLSSGGFEHGGEIDLKDAMMPMVSFARLYALRHQIDQTHTLERIEALSERDIILPSSRDEIIVAYDLLMQLRLQNQMSALMAGRQPTNLIVPGKLGNIQKELLKQAFAQIAAVQKKVSYDFLGGI